MHHEKDPMTDTPPGAPTSASTPVNVSLSVGRGDGPSLLDYILIVGALGLLGYGLHGLMMGDVSEANLPTIASLLSFLTGTILGSYAGYRWGASATMKRGPGADGAK